MGLKERREDPKVNAFEAEEPFESDDSIKYLPVSKDHGEFPHRGGQ